MAGYFTAVRHWNPAEIGIAIAAQKLASVIAQASAGWLIDKTGRKTWVMAGSAVAISLGAACVVWAPGVLAQAANQAMVGVATSMATLLLPAISLGLVGRSALGERIGRNGAFSHGGNMLTASLAGYLGAQIGAQWIFYISAMTGIACALCALSIRSDDIDNEVAREAPAGAEWTASPATTLLRNPVVLTFGAAVLLFHVANSALLPLAGEEISGHASSRASIYLMLSIVVPQLVMIPMSPLSGRGAKRFGRKPVFLLGFAALVLRGLLFAVSSRPEFIIAVEMLDGVGTAIASVVTVLIVADLAKGTGRFNALGGVMQSALGVGAFLGNLLAGLAAARFGFPPTFYGLAAVALAGLILFALAVPDTCPPTSRGDRP